MTAWPFLVASLAGLTAGYAAAVILLLAPEIWRWWRRRRLIADIAREIGA